MRLKVRQLYVTKIVRQLKAKAKPPHEGKRSTLHVQGMIMYCKEHLGETIMEAVICHTSSFSPSHNIKSVYVNTERFYTHRETLKHQ